MFSVCLLLYFFIIYVEVQINWLATWLKCSRSPTKEGNDDSRGLMVRIQDRKRLAAEAAVLPGATSHSGSQHLSS